MKWNDWLLSIVLLACFTGCSDEKVTDGIPSESVEVRLELSVDEEETVMTRSLDEEEGQEESHSTEGAVHIRMAKEAVSSTRALNESAITSFTVFQFDGVEDESALKRIDHYSNANSKIVLDNYANSRVAVIANIPFNKIETIMYNRSFRSWSNATWTASTFDDYTNSSTGIPMSGYADIQVSEGGAVKIHLKRNLCKITVKCKGSGISGLLPQLCSGVSMPKIYPHTGNEVGSNQGNTLSSSVGDPFSSTAFKEYVYYVPCNRRGVVSGATSLSRRKKAPNGATYLNVVYNFSSYLGLGRGQAIFFIYLGGNLTDDYNLNPNYAYTYEMEFYGKDLYNDPRVEFTYF